MSDFDTLIVSAIVSIHLTNDSWDFYLYRVQYGFILCIIIRIELYSIRDTSVTPI